MTETVYRMTFELSADELKRQFTEDKTFRADRHRGGLRIRYMIHAEGFVMVRGPGMHPIVISEKEWRSLPAEKD